MPPSTCLHNILSDTLNDEDADTPKYRYAVLTPGILTPTLLDISSRMVPRLLMFQT